MRVPQISERVKEAPAHALRSVFAGIGQLLLVTDKLRNKTPASAGVPRTPTADPAGTTPVPPETEPAASPGPAAAEPASDAAVADAAVANAAVAEQPAAASVAGVAEPVAAEPAAAEPVAAVPAAAKPVTAKRAAAKPAAVKPVAAKRAAAKPVAAKPVAAEPTAAEPAEIKPAVTEPGSAKAVRTTARKSATKPPARDFDKTGNVRLLAGQEDAEAAASEVPAVPAETAPPPLPNYDELSVASLRARLRNLGIPQLKEAADYERAHAGRAEVIAMFERRVAKLEAEPEAGA